MVEQSDVRIHLDEDKGNTLSVKDSHVNENTVTLLNAFKYKRN